MSDQGLAVDASTSGPGLPAWRAAPSAPPTRGTSGAKGGLADDVISACAATHARACFAPLASLREKSCSPRSAATGSPGRSARLPGFARRSRLKERSQRHSGVDGMVDQDLAPIRTVLTDIQRMDPRAGVFTTSDQCMAVVTASRIVLACAGSRQHRRRSAVAFRSIEQTGSPFPRECPLPCRRVRSCVRECRGRRLRAVSPGRRWRVRSVASTSSRRTSRIRSHRAGRPRLRLLSRWSAPVSARYRAT